MSRLVTAVSDLLSFLLGYHPRKKKVTLVDDVAVPEDFGDFSLAKTIISIEGRVSDDITDEREEDDVIPNTGEEMGAGGLP